MGTHLAVVATGRLSSRKLLLLFLHVSQKHLRLPAIVVEFGGQTRIELMQMEVLLTRLALQNGLLLFRGEGLGVLQLLLASVVSQVNVVLLKLKHVCLAFLLTQEL